MTEKAAGFGGTTAGRLVEDAVPASRRVAFDAPWEWLAAGWRDLWRQPHLSLAYGAVFAVAAALLALSLVLLDAQAVFLALAGGFMLIGPLVAVGLYEASRRLAEGRPVTLPAMLRAGLDAPGQLAFFGVMLMFAFLVWVQIAFLLMMLFLAGTSPPTGSELLSTLLLTPRGLGLLIVGTIVGGLIAATVFAMSAVAVPLMLERRVDAVTAARASATAVLRNPKPMALWAALIVVMMAAGFATLLAGLVVAFPLIGHATWHAYRDLLGAD